MSPQKIKIKNRNLSLILGVDLQLYTTLNSLMKYLLNESSKLQRHVVLRGGGTCTIEKYILDYMSWWRWCSGK